MIVLVDYGSGNLGSLSKALLYLGETSAVSGDPETVLQADRLILPGVGAMSYAMERLRNRHLDEAIRRYLLTGRPFLGICLGMQLMFDESEEGAAKGLGIIAGTVRRIPALPGLKVPHMGWNRIETSRLSLIPPGASYYFVHSYYVDPKEPEWIAATTRHGIDFPSAVAKGSVLLTQFHPEKSGDEGIRFLSGWLKGEKAG